MEEIQSREHLVSILQTHSYVVVDIYTDWCQPCKYLTPLLEDLMTKLEHIKFVKLNGERELIDVNGFPSVLYFKGGHLVNTTLGADINEVTQALHRLFNDENLKPSCVPWKRSVTSVIPSVFLPQSSAVRGTRKM